MYIDLDRKTIRERFANTEERCALAERLDSNHLVYVFGGGNVECLKLNEKYLTYVRYFNVDDFGNVVETAPVQYSVYTETEDSAKQALEDMLKGVFGENSDILDGYTRYGVTIVATVNDEGFLIDFKPAEKFLAENSSQNNATEAGV